VVERLCFFCREVPRGSSCSESPTRRHKLIDEQTIVGDQAASDLRGRGRRNDDPDAAA
jgi:hypothetical protein